MRQDVRYTMRDAGADDSVNYISASLHKLYAACVRMQHMPCDAANQWETVHRAVMRLLQMNLKQI